jgi:hypothetical protein
MIRKSRNEQARAGFRRLQKAGLHLDGYAAAGISIEGSAGYRHCHIEQRHEHPAVRDGPTIEVPRLKIERHHGAAAGGADELDSELFDKRDIKSKCGRLSHTKPYLAPPVHVNQTLRRAQHDAGTMSSMLTAGSASILRFAALLLATLLLGVPAVWAALALWYQAPGGALKSVLVLLWSGFTLGILIALWQGRAGLAFLSFALAFAVLLVWWQSITPTNERLWADDVAQITNGTVDGNHVTLRNVRNFDWRSDSDYTQRWETRGYDLDKLTSVDMIMSYWDGWAIAHMLVSFGFDDGQHVAFSVEVRRRKNETYSELGGFFKRDGLSIIAADERDVIRVRTNIRGEDDYLYRIRMPLPAMRSLFLGYVEQADGLVNTPRFYNTITVNCTTLVYHMMKRIIGYLPWSYRLLFTGYLPAYVYRVGGLDQRFTLEELRALGRITDRARQSDRSDNFSADIRKGIPIIEPADLPPAP